VLKLKGKKGKLNIKEGKKKEKEKVGEGRILSAKQVKTVNVVL